MTRFEGGRGYFRQVLNKSLFEGYLFSLKRCIQKKSTHGRRELFHELPFGRGPKKTRTKDMVKLNDFWDWCCGMMA